MVKKFALSFVILGSFIHIFCCGLPLLLSLTSFAAMIGISSAKLMQISWFVGSMQVEILIFSGLVLAFALGVQWVAYRINCRENAHCEHKACDEKKSFSEWMLIIALVLYAVNILIFFITR